MQREKLHRLDILLDLLEMTITEKKNRFFIEKQRFFLKKMVVDLKFNDFFLEKKGHKKKRNTQFCRA